MLTSRTLLASIVLGALVASEPISAQVSRHHAGRHAYDVNACTLQIWSGDPSPPQRRCRLHPSCAMLLAERMCLSLPSPWPPASEPVTIGRHSINSEKRSWAAAQKASADSPLALQDSPSSRTCRHSCPVPGGDLSRCSNLKVIRSLRRRWRAPRAEW
jgi:hypothetical protein